MNMLFVHRVVTDSLLVLVAGGMTNLLGGKEESMVEAILDAMQDSKVIAEQLSAALCRQSHHVLSKVAGYQGQLAKESLPNLLLKWLA